MTDQPAAREDEDIRLARTTAMDLRTNWPSRHTLTHAQGDLIVRALEAYAAPVPERGALREACAIGLAIAGHYHPDTPVDPWLAAHEKRLRELEKVAAPVPERGGNVTVPRAVLRRYYDIACGRVIGRLDEMRPELLALLSETGTAK